MLAGLRTFLLIAGVLAAACVVAFHAMVDQALADMAQSSLAGAAARIVFDTQINLFVAECAAVLAWAASCAALLFGPAFHLGPNLPTSVAPLSLSAVVYAALVAALYLLRRRPDPHRRVRRMAPPNAADHARLAARIVTGVAAVGLVGAYALLTADHLWRYVSGEGPNVFAELAAAAARVQAYRAIDPNFDHPALEGLRALAQEAAAWPRIAVAAPGALFWAAAAALVSWRVARA